jgi:transglutaminase-like putative cysteine protease
MKRWGALLLWTIVVLYPNPYLLYISAQRAWSPPVDPQAVRALAATLPNNGRAIEAAVMHKIVPYAVPWDTYGVPWYFPTADEVLAAGQGDCEAQAVVLASLLRAKGIPARFVGSIDHLWVDYPGKHATAYENTTVAIAAQRPDGSYHFKWPRLQNWRTSWEIERSYFWDAMPAARRWLLLGGWLLIGLSRRIARRWPIRGFTRSMPLLGLLPRKDASKT